MNILYTGPRDIYATPAFERVVSSLDGVYSKLIVVDWNDKANLKSKDRIEYHFKKNKNYFTLILWQFYLLKKLFFHRPDVIFNMSILSFIPILFYKLFFKIKIIYDCRDYFAVSYSFNTITEKILNKVDNFFAKNSDYVIIPDLYGKSYFNKIKKEKFVLLYNTTKSYGLKKTFKNDNIIRLGYLGYLSLDRNIIKILEFIKKTDNVELHIACNYIPENIKHIIPESSNKIILHNKLSHFEAHKLLSKMDYCLLSYNPKLGNYKFIQPTKFYDCLSLGLPYICSKGMVNLEKHVNRSTQNISVEYDSLNFSKLTKTNFCEYNKKLYDTNYSYEKIMKDFTIKIKKII